MAESSTATVTQWFSARAGLAAVGVRLRQLDLFGPIRQQVRIAQKRVKYAPSEKLYDAFIAILAGAHGLVEVNTRLRSDRALQHAFGRAGCAEQSVVQDTLDACTAENVAQLEQALDTIYRRHSRGYRHDYAAGWQVLDVDMSGLPCGPKAAFATKGYFAKQRNRRGRQLGRVVASRYDEIVVDRLFDGKTQLSAALQPLVLAAEHTLELDEARRQRTILRVDAAGGSLADVLALTRQPHPAGDDAAAVALADVYFYDQRSGGCETANKGSKQGLGLTKRNKRRFAAQQMLMLLGTLAYNVLSWGRAWLSPRCPHLARYGMLRFVRDVGHISGFLLVDGTGRIGAIVLNQAAPLAAGLAGALDTLLADDGVAVSLGQT